MSRELRLSWVSLFGLVLGQQIASTACLAVFLSTVGADSLPMLFVARSFVDIPVMLLYSHRIAKSERSAHLPFLLLLSGVVLLPVPFIFPFFPGATAFCAYLAVNSMTTVLTVEWGSQVVELFSGSESRRSVPVVYSASAIGGMAAGALVGILSPRIGALWLVVVAALPSLMSACISRRLAVGPAGERAREPSPGLDRQGSPLRLLSSPLIRSIAVSTLLLVLLRNALNFQYNVIFDGAFPQRESLAAFLGWYVLAANGVAVVLQIYLLPRLGRRWGIGTLNLMYAGALLLSLLGIAVFPVLLAALIGRFIDNEGKGAVKTPLSGLFYDVLAPVPRRQARSFVLGFVSPIGACISGLILMALLKAPPVAVPIFTVAASLAYYLASREQASAYRESLRSQLAGSLARAEPERPIEAGASLLSVGLAHPSTEIRETARTLEMELRPLFGAPRADR